MPSARHWLTCTATVQGPEKHEFSIVSAKNYILLKRRFALLPLKISGFVPLMLDRIKSLLGWQETKSLANPSPELFALFGSVPTASGITVGPETALRSPAVRQALQLIGGSIAALPIRVKRQGPNGLREELTPANYRAAAVLKRPNSYTGQTAFVRDLIADLVLEGNAFALATKVRGEVRELIRVPPSTAGIERDLRTLEPRYRIALADGASNVYRSGEVVHLRGLPMPDGLRGRGLVHDAREAIALDLVMAAHAAGLFGNGARPSGVLKYGKTVSPDILKRLRDSFAAMYSGGANSGKPLILEDGMAWEQSQFSSVDLQFNELRRFAVADIARAANLSPLLLGDTEKATFSNAEQATQNLLSLTLIPIIELLEDALERVLIPEADRDAVSIEVDTEGFARADLEKRIAAMAKRIEIGVGTINEERATLGRAPVAGGDEPRTSVQSQPLGAPAQTPEPTP
jgi:HK97 family phage portal protein